MSEISNRQRTRIHEWVETHCETVLFALQDLIRVPSFSGQESEMMRQVAARFRELGAAPRLVSFAREAMRMHPAYIETTELGCPESYDGRPCVTVRLPGAGGGRSIILNAHCDTVGVDDVAAWVYPPFGAEIADGRIYGRGAWDDKSDVAIELAVYSLLRDLNIHLRDDLIFQCVIEEEAGGNGTLQCVMDGQRADGAIYLESVGNGLVVCAGRGVHFFEIQVHSEPVMNLRLWEKPSAIDHALHVYEAVRKFNIQRNSRLHHPLYDLYPDSMPKAPLAITQICGGINPSTTPASVTMTGAAECLPGESLAELESEFAAFLERLPQDHPDQAKARIELCWWGMRMEPAETPIDHPLVISLSQCSQMVLGYPSFLVGAGGCDLRLTNLHAATPSVMYGPSGGNGHGTDEYVEIASLLETIESVALTVIDFCGVEEHE